MSVNHLVTVFCARDWAQFCLQVESLKLLAEPLTHWVIVNEADADQWQTKITPLYQDLPHRVIVMPRPRELSGCGWRNQQYYKLWIYSLIQDSYLILDCKNFLIRSTDPMEFRSVIGSNSTYNYLDDANSFRSSLNYYTQALGLEISRARHFSCQTPFLADRTVMSALDLALFEASWGAVSPSEFLYYSVWAQRLGIEFKLVKRPLFRTIWPHETLDQFCFEQKLGYAIFGLHRDWLTAKSAHRDMANLWLSDLGFKSRL
jgi:hypothetical protein